MKKEKIGIDLDNTIINYDKTFFKIALKEKLITKNLYQDKEKIRNYVLSKKGLDKWRKLQSIVYSNHLHDAKIQNGFIKFLKLIQKKNYDYCIISHKTKYPYFGKKIDLQKSSKEWINKNICNQANIKKLKKNQIFFENTKEKKIKRILKEKCNYFIDDLPSILEKLPLNVKKILIDPKSINKKSVQYLKLKKWIEISKVFF